MRVTNNKQLITDNGGRESPPSEVISYMFSVISSRDGQSLIEVVIGLAIGSILIGASAFAISTMLQTNLASQKGQAATAFAQELLNKARVYGSASWQSLYGLTKASSTQYFLNASGTTYAVVPGREGMLDNDVTNGLVAEWKFDEDAASTSTTTYDATGNGNNGTLTNSPTRATSTCRIVNCLKFDGATQRVTLGPVQIGTLTTVSAWIVATTTLQRPVLSNRGSGLYFGITGGKFFTYYNTATPPAMVSAKSVNDNAWHLVTWVSNGTTSVMYIDGLLDNTQAQSRSTSTSNGYIAFDSPNIEYFPGSIDDVRIYNRALSADEVRQLWNSNIFVRYFYVENICRTNNASSSISGVAPCGSGSADDPSTQKVTAVTQWTTGQGAGITTLSDYLTRWKNTIFRQTDWSGGGGATSPVTSPGSTFSSSSGANFGGGSIRIQGL